MQRIGKEAYYLSIAAQVARRSTCLRRQYGAVIVNHDEIVGHRLQRRPARRAQLLRRGRMLPRGAWHPARRAVLKSAWPCTPSATPSSAPARKEMLGATLYLAGFEGGKPLEDPQPCLICNRLIKNAGIARVINARGEVRL